MGIISAIRSLLGLGRSRDRRETETTVPVERERTSESTPDTTDRGVTGGTDPADAVGTTAPTREASEPVDAIKGIGPAYSERLQAAGVETVADLAAADANALSDQTDIGVNRLQNWIDRAQAR